MIKVPSKYSKEEYVQVPKGGLSNCPGCGTPIALRQFLKATGGDVVFVVTMGCPKPALRYGDQPIRMYHTNFGLVATGAGGLKSGLTARGHTETVVCWAGDGATFDIGFGGLSASAERNEDILYVVYDNESYVNTGGQRSSATPWGAMTSTNPVPATKRENKKDIMAILAGHGIPYAATVTVAFPEDLMRKAKKAKSMRGFRFIHLLAPCPTEWRYPENWSVKMSRLAVETKIFPLFEVEDGTRYTINYEPNGVTPVEEYLKIQGRFRSLTPEQIVHIQKTVDQRWNRLQRLAKS